MYNKNEKTFITIIYFIIKKIEVNLLKVFIYYILIKLIPLSEDQEHLLYNYKIIPQKPELE